MLCWALAACAIPPVQHAGTAAVQCTAPRFAYRLSLDPAGQPAPGAPENVSTVSPELDAALARAYRDQRLTPYAPDEEPVSNSMLLLSGGSEDGAFGAGFLDQWARTRTERNAATHPTRRGLPRFRVVTGISTGSLQASFAFLDEPEVNVASYAISQERQLLRPLVSRGLKEQPVHGALSLARHGTLASLDPLRALLHRLLDPRRLAAIAHEAADHEGGRKLLAGAVEMDSGDLVVFDLGEYARAWAAARDAEDAPRAAAFKDCYVEALLASSSVPMAAPPVFIDGKMFIDGGARFGVFLNRLDKALSANGRVDQEGRPKDSLFMLVNGTLKVEPQCTLGPCPAASPRWRFDALAFRSLSILINQSYVSSVNWAQSVGSQHHFVPEIARMETGPGGFAEHRSVTGLPSTGDEVRTCAQWKAEDNAREHPLEFHPRFMRCLIDYGRHHHAVARWAGRE